MQKFYYKCAALLLAVGLLFPCTTALAQMPKENTTIVGLSSVDSGPPPTLDNGGLAITYTASVNEETLFHTATRADWALDVLPKPEISWLFQAGEIGNADKMREFSIQWSQSDYDAGLASGAERFTITGCYVPANAEDQALWDKELLRVNETSVPKMEVRVTNAAALPFKVELGRDEAANGYYPIFAFPLPHGASEVRFEASNNGTHWFTCEETYKSNHSEAFMEPNAIYSMQYAIYTEDGEPFFFDAHKKSYYRVTVYGSAYDANGCGAQSTYTLNTVSSGSNPPDSSLDDIDGNRDGGAQGETDRPGKVPEEEKPKEPVLAQSGGQKPAPRAPAPIAAPPESALHESDAASTQSSVAESAPSAFSEPQTQEVLATAEELPDPKPPDRGSAGAVAAATATIIITGAGGTYLIKTKRKP